MWSIGWEWISDSYLRGHVLGQISGAGESHNDEERRWNVFVTLPGPQK